MSLESRLTQLVDPKGDFDLGEVVEVISTLHTVTSGLMYANSRPNVTPADMQLIYRHAIDGLLVRLPQLEVWAKISVQITPVLLATVDAVLRNLRAADTMQQGNTDLFFGAAAIQATSPALAAYVAMCSGSRYTDVQQALYDDIMQ